MVGLVTALGVASCSSSTGPSASGAVLKAVSATLGAGTVQVQATSVTPTASGSDTAKATGSYDLAADEGAYSVDTGALLGTVQALATESTLYIRLPAAIAATVAGRQAVGDGEPPAPTAHPGHRQPAQRGRRGRPDPALIGLQEGMTSTRKFGVASGVTHYQATVDLTKASSPLASSEITLLGGSTETDDIYVGSDGRIQRLVQSIRLSGGGTPEVVTTDFSNYGKPVSITIPAAEPDGGRRQAPRVLTPPQRLSSISSLPSWVAVGVVHQRPTEHGGEDHSGDEEHGR